MQNLKNKKISEHTTSYYAVRSIKPYTVILPFVIVTTLKILA